MSKDVADRCLYLLQNSSNVVNVDITGTLINYILHLHLHFKKLKDQSVWQQKRKIHYASILILLYLYFSIFRRCSRTHASVQAYC